MWEGSPTNMLGNDRYISYVKLHKGVNPLALEEQVHTFVNSYFPPEEQQKTGFNMVSRFMSWMAYTRSCRKSSE